MILLLLLLAATASELDVPVGSWRHVAKAAPVGTCDGMVNSYQCALAVETQRLRSTSVGVCRDGTVLRITLKSGAVLKLADEPGDRGAKYTYVDRLSSGHHLVHVQYYEDGGYMLIEPRTGSQFELEEYPSFSPDGEYVVTVAPLDSEQRALRVKVLQSGAYLSLVWEGELGEATKGYGYGWLSPTNVIVVRRAEDGTEQRQCIERANKGWVILSCRPAA